MRASNETLRNDLGAVNDVSNRLRIDLAPSTVRGLIQLNESAMGPNTSPAPADPAAEIVKLRNDWPQLGGIDRANRVAKIKALGLPTRFIARELGCSESLLRHLLKALKAPAVDRVAARQGKLPTNEVVRRAEAEIARQADKRAKDDGIMRQQKVAEACRAIRKWLAQEHLNEASTEAVAEEARRMLIEQLRAGNLPEVEGVHAAAKWIERFRPQTPPDDQIHYIGWYALWLAKWSFCFCRDPEIAIDALGIVARI